MWPFDWFRRRREKRLHEQANARVQRSFTSRDRGYDGYSRRDEDDSAVVNAVVASQLIGGDHGHSHAHHSDHSSHGYSDHGSSYGGDSGGGGGGDGGGGGGD